ncbi:YbaB/EbfC family nucleoid-associated protein [Micromonospora halotolerans]|uniref:YbaB/EbfC family nucleoid-associated protein n=1 Tax=Micromonospora halotolerans TaxID=709879 RepID=A0ABY9ZT45_9ACTN|nr:YbaB/EbfC family nucleoid-associated protein [Micromonospora halotolerans]WNM38082.1 YbaB/EbfC family nucleoid-associated protein [Micromonospora halotolerans]
MSGALSGGVLDPDGAMDQMRAWKGRIDKLAADTKAMSDRLQELRVVAEDDNGLAEVTVDSSGALLDLRLGRQIQRVSPEVVAQAVLEAIRRAKGQLAERSQEIIAETVGTESPAARAIAERVGRQLRPDPEPGRGEPGSYDGHGWQR